MQEVQGVRMDLSRAHTDASDQGEARGRQHWADGPDDSNDGLSTLGATFGVRSESESESESALPPPLPDPAEPPVKQLGPLHGTNLADDEWAAPVMPDDLPMGTLVSAASLHTAFTPHGRSSTGQHSSIGHLRFDSSDDDDELHVLGQTPVEAEMLSPPPVEPSASWVAWEPPSSVLGSAPGEDEIDIDPALAARVSEQLDRLFGRYDLDGVGALTEGDEFHQLSINLVSALRLKVPMPRILAELEGMQDARSFIQQPMSQAEYEEWFLRVFARASEA